MSRYANGSQPTGEYQSRAEYDAGYRDGQRAATERCKEQTTHLRAQLETLQRLMADAATASPPTLVVTAEQVKQFIGR